jgi:hypothetical protein
MHSIAIHRFNPALALKQSFAVVLIAATLMMSSCSTLQGLFSHIPSTDQVKFDTSLVVTATREAVLLAGVAAETTLNAYILAVHTAAAGLSEGITKGTSVMPTPADIQAFLTQKAAAFGSPVWMMNFIGNLVTEYTKFYNVISKDSAVAAAYLNAFVAGTV